MTKLKKLLAVIMTALILICSAVPSTVFAATESQIRNTIVSVASGEVGYSSSSTYSKYGEWYGYQGGWCTSFALWCYNKAGEKLGVKLYCNGITPSGGNCNSMISWYKNKGRYHTRKSGYTPQSGDLVFFDWSGNGSSQHVGIVDYVSGSTIHTIEGNCSGKVKAREYTTKGSKPYNNVSSIMGYASPNFSSVAGGSNTTKKTTEKKKTTTKKQATKTTAKKTTTKTTKKSTTKATTKTTIKKVTTTTTTTTTTKKTTTAIPVEKLSIKASTYNLKVGDTVKLDYSIEPHNAKAVVGYFCDDEGIITIDSGGDITAIGNGTATVVVCANDELYSQCEFKVSNAVAEVTTLEQNTTRKIIGKVTTESNTQMDAQAFLSKAGVNVNALTQNTSLYIIPLAIICITGVFAVIIKIKKKNQHNGD